MAKKALGKGLGALIKQQPTSTETAKENNGSQANAQTAIDNVVPSPLQPRKHFSEEQLEELVDSIRQHGIIQPLIVRKVNGKMELIAGERRWRASKQLGLKEVPIRVREATDHEVLEMALIENIQRKDLDPIEEAQGYVRLAKEFAMKQDIIAKRVGKSRASVANAMRLLELHPSIQDHVAQSRLSVGHAKAILSIKDHDTQCLAADKILKKSLTVRAAEKLARDLSKPKSETPSQTTSREADAVIQQIQNTLRERFATDVKMVHNSKKGKIELTYYGNDDLQRLLDLLGIQL
ncbi:ParB/RepB/Spo0J family partition protein [Verrucomicrobiaceae bacterium N1E253]|uniref:ParB/RepB/Spo0J family partition protein n=1 Tax=Oceaniferula marina TaxID=2748318 RepID=A0A851GCW6_9BACT|nr:ParB/RepB/Spo0J family partition protein [Oceaniferula marina]NWK54782.1 ParB/RepB/Spo0J family partition protein [Oceaniferula marina]